LGRQHHHATLYELVISESPDAHRRRDCIRSGFAYSGSATFGAAAAARSEDRQRVPMSLKRMANILGTDAVLFQEFCDRLSKYGDKTLFVDGQAVEVPVF
jgi:hypothetical protein